jgi:DNA-binding MarR family transcriptional regulator
VKIYELCLSHSRADRALRTKVAELLEPEQLTMMQWLLLGALSGSKNGLSMSDIANRLGITLPQVTALLSNLDKRRIVKLRTQRRDRRSRHALLSAKGEALLSLIDAKLEEAAEVLFPNETRQPYADLLIRMYKENTENTLEEEDANA